jgi:hypothetical protein
MSVNPNEYVLLKIAVESLSLRNILLQVSYSALEQIENGTWFHKIDDKDKIVIRSYVNIDIISKIMMYIEDVVVYSKSFIANKNYYSEFLAPSSKDLGEVIKCFFKCVDDLSDNDILKMMSWIDMTSAITNHELTESIKIIKEYNITKVRNILSELKDFGESNHPLYKRYKHGGMPVVPDAIQNIPKQGILSVFDTFSVVSIGNDPLVDVHITPFSNEVLQRYKSLVKKLQNLLDEMIKNRIACIQRNIASVFPRSYPTGKIDPELIKQIEVERQSYYQKYPAENMPSKLNFNVDLWKIRNAIPWYFKKYEAL